MANFDFSEKLPVTADDEIGGLSGSINTLSVNLKDRIDRLNVANTKLQQDIERERQLENKKRIHFWRITRIKNTAKCN